MYVNIINDFINQMNSSTSSNNKVELMMHCDPLVKKTLYYTYNSFLQFGVTSKILEKRRDLVNKTSKYNSPEDIFDLLDALHQRLYTGHEAIKQLNSFILKNSNMKDILYLVLNRNLKVRASVKLINKAIPGLIPEFNVALANKYDDNTKKKVDFRKDVWYVSRKLDGVRCLIVVDEKGKAKSFSRAGKQFHTLSLVEKEIELLGFKNVVYDGEMCIVNKEGNEDFQTIMKEISRKDHTIQNGIFQAFDYIPYQMFSKGCGEAGTFKQRVHTLQKILADSTCKHVSFLEQIPMTSFEELDKLIAKASEKDWEGLMLRKNDIYKGKRSNDILKVKTFHDDEYTVSGINTGPFRYVKEGIEVEEDMLTAVVVNHRGNIVRVGSGFSIAQRKQFFKYPSDILGKEITVQYFEETQNQNGNFSLRFPVVKAIHENKRNL